MARGDKIIFLSGGVSILGGKEQIYASGRNERIELTISDFDFVMYDVHSNTFRIIDSNPGIRKLHERYHFTPNRAGCLLFSVESDLENLELVDAAIEDALKNFPVNQVDVGITLSEIIYNAMQVAAERSHKKDIQVSLLYIPNFGLFLSVTDQLGRFNLEDLPASFLDAVGNPSLAEHGRGLLIIAELMEWVAYNPCGDDEGYKEILIRIPMTKTET